MPPRRSLFCLLALALGGCDRYPEDPIFAYGEAQRSDGTPWSGLTVTVERAQAALNPKPGDPPPSFQPYAEATSGANGRFTLETLKGDTDTIFKSDSEQYSPRFRLALPLEEGRGTWLSFEQDDDVELPTLRPWDSKLARVEGQAGPALTFSSPPPPPALPPTAEVPMRPRGDGTFEPHLPPPPEPVLQLHSGDQVLWQEKGPASPWAPTPWLLEDFASPEAQVRAATAGNWFFSPLGSSSGGVRFRMEWRSERLAWPAGSLRPVSRGAACLPATPEVCPWTDGALTPVILRDLLDTYPNEVGVELETPTHVSRVVIRGLDVSPNFDHPENDRLVLEGSAEGTQWTRLAELAPFQAKDLSSSFLENEHWDRDSPFDPPLQTEQHFLFLDIPLVDAPPVRQVRVFVQAGRGNRAILRELAELSLFE